MRRGRGVKGGGRKGEREQRQMTQLGEGRRSAWAGLSECGVGRQL